MRKSCGWLAKTCGKLVYFIMVILFLSIVPGILAEDNLNLIKNGDFENPGKNARPGPDCWSVYPSDAAAENELVRDSGEKSEGEYSLRFINIKRALIQNIAVKEGEHYTVSCYFKCCLSNGMCGLHVQFLDDKGKFVYVPAPESQKGKPWVRKDGTMQSTFNRNIAGFQGWKKAEMDIVVPPGAKKAQIIIAGQFEPVGEFWVDDVRMTPVRLKEVNEPLKASVTINKTGKPPVLDGKLDDECWNGCAEISQFSEPALKSIARAQTSVKICYDENAMYLAVKCDDAAMDKLVTLAKQRDDEQIYHDDCVEIFVKPEMEGQKFFQFLVNAKGLLWDRTVMSFPGEVKGNEAFKLSGNPVAAGVDKKSWTLEMRIPFAELGVTSPADLAAWGFNVIRDKRTAPAASTSWSSLNTFNFQDPQLFGTLVFGGNTPCVSFNGVSGRMASFGVKNFTDKNVSVEVCVDSLQGASLMPLGQKIVELKPNEDKHVSMDLRDCGVGMVWASASTGNRLLSRVGFLPCSRYASVGWYDPQNILGNKFYLASDLPRSFRSFYTTHNFEGGIGDPKYIRRSKEPVELFIELPKGIQAVSLDMRVMGWQNWDPVTPASVEDCNVNGQECKRYQFSLPGITGHPMPEGPYIVFFETSLPAGTKTTCRMYLKWKDGQQVPKTYEIEVIEVGRMKPFKKFISGMYYAAPEILLQWMPENLGTLLPKLGINTLDYEPNPVNPYEVGPKESVKHSRGEWYDMLNAEARKGGLFGSTQLCATVPYWQGWTSYGKDQDVESRAMNINGAPVMDERWSNCYSICASYRGREYQKWLSSLLNSSTIQKYKLSWIALDCEFWTRKAWDDACFCKRCLDGYVKYCVQKHPGVKPGNPIEFMKSAKDNPKNAEMWKEYREWTKHDFVGTVRREISAVVSKSGGQSSPKSGVVISDWILPSPHSPFDYFEMNFYWPLPKVMERCDKFGEMCKSMRNLIGSCSFGQSCTEDTFLTVQDMRYKIYECAAAGVQGIRWHHVYALDMLKLKNLVDGLRSIQPFENIMLDGMYHGAMPCDQKGVTAAGTRFGDEMLVVVREYNTKDKISSVVTLRCNGQAVVYDCHTGETLGEVSPETPRITVAIDAERARLFYVGPKAKLAARQSH